MIRAIIFDCFGVLTSDGWLPFKRRHFGHDKVLFQEATDLNKQAGSGMMSGREFIARIADMAKVSADYVARQILGSRPNEELFGYIRDELKPEYRIGLLSNTSSNTLHELFSQEQVALFDALSLSYEIGTVKPYPEAYRHILDQLDVSAEEAVFIDDQERHCTGARDVGLQAIVYEDFEQMKAELEAILRQSGKPAA